jgi:hypothetical protein
VWTIPRNATTSLRRIGRSVSSAPRRSRRLLAIPLNGFFVLGLPGNGKCLPVGAEIALQRPQVLVTSTMAGDAEAHSHVAPPKLAP